MGKRIHGLAKRGEESSTYIVWKHMRQRCLNSNDKSYSYYGGRGISICTRWDSYENFLKDMGERPNGLEIDRIDSNGNYEPSNCRWADRLTQVNNRLNCRMFEYQGKTLTAKQWSKEKGIAYGTLIDRLNRGCPFTDAIETPSPKLLTDDQKQVILSMWRQGFKKSEIHDKTGIDYDRIKYQIKVKAG